jgi:hypothetical protein
MVEMKVSELMVLISSAFPLDYKMRWQKLQEMVNAAEQGLHLTGGIQLPSEPLSAPKPGTGVEYLSHQPTSK